MMKYYSSKKIREMNCQYNIIFGKRSNGKTFDALIHAVEDFYRTGKQFAYVRRWKEDITGSRASELFNSLINDGKGKNRIADLTGGLYDTVLYRNRRWYLTNLSDQADEKKSFSEMRPMAFGFSLSDMEHDKGSSFPDITTIIFDEFTTRGYYLKDEFAVFMNVISTIIRHRTDVKIYMLGNTVDQFCPYFNEMGITGAKTMEQGTIDVYTYGNTNLRVAVEYCEDNTGKKSKTGNLDYFAFDNPKLKMITSGAWEIDIYPHLPYKYKPSDVLAEYFIKYQNEILHAEVIEVENDIFTYIHRKTSEIKHPDCDLILSDERSPKPNVIYNLFRSTIPAARKIVWFFQNDKVFYQSNDIGEIVNSFLNFCRANR